VALSYWKWNASFVKMRANMAVTSCHWRRPLRFSVNFLPLHHHDNIAMRIWISLACVLSSWCISVNAQTIKTIPFKDGVHAYAVTEPEQKPRAILVMFIGGDGGLNLVTRGSLSGVNVLIRMRPALEAAGMTLLYVDIPDRQFSRSDAEYARSVGKIIEQENSAKLPVFVAGISRGSISAANVASRVPVSGMILLSAVTGSTYDGTVRDAPVADISAPSLLLIHNRDACVSSGSESALRSFARDMKKSSSTIVVLEGGRDESSGVGRTAACHPKSYHGFNGIDTNVAGTIMKWISSVTK